MPSAAASGDGGGPIYSVEGLSGLGGRLLFGVLADRLGVKQVLIAGLAVQAVAIASYLLVDPLWPSSIRSRSYSVPPMAASCRSMRCWRANTSASASWGRCSAPRPWFRRSAWPLARGGRLDLRRLRQLLLALHRGLHRCAWRSRRLPGLHRAVATACVATRPTKRAADARHGITASVCSHTRSCRISSERVSGWQRLR